MDCSLPGFSVHGISQAGVLEWVTISFSMRSSWQGSNPCLFHWPADFFFFFYHWSTREVQFGHSVQFSHLVVSWLFATLWTAAHQTSLSITNSQSLPKFMSIELVMPYNHLILCCPLLLQSSVFASIRVFSWCWLFAWGGQSVGVSASASVLPIPRTDLL